jgi:TolB-like protein
MQYRTDTNRDLQVANALGVANVLEETVRPDGNHVRVSSKLVDAVMITRFGPTVLIEISPIYFAIQS